jgi:hypothetical protein
VNVLNTREITSLILADGVLSPDVVDGQPCASWCG